MYVNNKLDVLVKANDWNKYTKSVILVLRSYVNQRQDNINPFNILLVNEVWLNSMEDANTFLDFLYKNDITSFVVNDSSTALLEGLVYMLSSQVYTVSITQGYSWKGKYNNEFGILIEIKRKRRRNC